jgi:hypothetical protein
MVLLLKFRGILTDVFESNWVMNNENMKIHIEIPAKNTFWEKSQVLGSRIFKEHSDLGKGTL